MEGKSTETISTLLASWVDRYSRELLSWALYRISDRQTAEDLVQDTFLIACQQVEKFEGKSEPRTWLFAILKNKIADHYRGIFKKNTQSFSALPYFDEDDTWLDNQRPKIWEMEPEDELLDNSQFNAVFENCMGKLPPQWHSSLHLKFIEETESAQICQELGITPTNYWQMLHRAKLQLRKCLEINWFKK